MREILFRGKSLKTGKWTQGYLFRCWECAYILWGMANDNADMTEVDLETVCQYTGLTDRDGKKIFEGDIVRYQFDNDDCPFPNKHTEKIIGKIFFSDFRASFSVTAGRNCSTSMNNDLFKYVQNGNRVEVIGNIFDNANLMGG